MNTAQTLKLRSSGLTFASPKEIESLELTRATVSPQSSRWSNRRSRIGPRVEARVPSGLTFALADEMPNLEENGRRTRTAWPRVLNSSEQTTEAGES